jgi:hypothetical protein
MPTIATASKTGTLEPKGDRPELQKWNVTLEDGRVAELLTKMGADAPTGEVTVTDSDYGLRAKKVQPEGRGGYNKPDPGRNASMAVSYAKDLVIADKIELGQLSAYAEKFYAFIESKSG